MDTPKLDVKYMDAGRAYLAALQNLGLNPEGLMWAYDSAVRRHVLVLVTEFFDLKGPLEISRVLFAAYNNAKTPKEIDPFVVRLHSTNQTLAKLIYNAATMPADIKLTAVKGIPVTNRSISPVAFEIGGLEVQKDEIIQIRQPRQGHSINLDRKWESFQRNAASSSVFLA